MIRIGRLDLKFISAEVAAAAKSPDVAGAIAAGLAFDQAFAAQDVDAVGALFADDLIVNTPANRVPRRDDVVGSSEPVG